MRSSAKETAPGRRERSTLRWVAAAILVPLAMLTAAVAGYLGGGFVRFAQEVSTFAETSPPARGDAIVVLTGGALRIDTAIDLLARGRARRLLISGVNPGTSATTLARMTETAPELFECCIDLDYAALDTIGNARSAVEWADAHGFQNLILVTSDYHMPRSLREFHRADGFLTLYPYAVRRTDFWRDDRVPTVYGLRVLLTEYAKLVGARFADLTGLNVRHLPAPLLALMPGSLGVIADIRAVKPDLRQADL